VSAKVVLITGSSRGIGAATARLAAKRGYAVCVSYLTNAGRAERVVSEIHASGGRAIAVQADTGDADAIMALFERVDRTLGRLTAMVNNAGILGQPGRLETCEAAAIRHVLDVNVRGVMLCSREAVKRMSTRSGGAGGSIVNVSSIAATNGGANQWLAYATSKGAINTFTVGLAKEVAGEGIRVNAISPGLIDTEIRADAGLGDSVDRVIIPQVPMGRIGTPEECAEAILWLMSDAAPYVTGAILPVTGGR
jgi:NAD(P)-dependent dehydrogenase (short-subunit alcohol dehydrogenase family)